MSLKLGNIDIAGTQVLYSTTGNNNDGAMTQAAVTTELNNKANDSEVVHKTGNETINGTKTFTSYIKRIINATGDWQSVLDIRDSSGNRKGFISYLSVNNGIQVQLSCTNVINGSQKYSTLGLTMLDDGRGYATAPASDVNGSIVTTVNKSKAANGYFRLGNGLIIQWGTITGSKSVTFHTPFTTANAAVMFQRSGADGTNDNDAVYNITTTSCYIQNYGGQQGGRWLAIGY